MISVNRRSSLFTIFTVIAVAAAVAMTIGAPAARSASYKTCGLSEREQDPAGEKPTYNLSLRRQVTSCATAKKVMNAFHACRPQAGHRCTKKVLIRWTCTGRKDSSTPQIFYATFTCTWGSRRVKGSYQQNT